VEVEVVVGEGSGYAVVEVAVGDGFSQLEVLVFALVDEEYRGCITAR
jgi:hypothetical protein